MSGGMDLEHPNGNQMSPLLVRERPEILLYVGPNYLMIQRFEIILRRRRKPLAQKQKDRKKNVVRRIVRRQIDKEFSSDMFLDSYLRIVCFLIK